MTYLERLTEALDREFNAHGDCTELFSSLLDEYHAAEEDEYRDAMGREAMCEAFGPFDSPFDAGGL